MEDEHLALRVRPGAGREAMKRVRTVSKEYGKFSLRIRDSEQVDV